MNRYSVRLGRRLPMVAYCALVIGWAPSTSAAQEPQETQELERGTLSGVVVDAASGVEIAAAVVLLLDEAGSVLTDRQGRFAFPDVRPGSRSLIVTQLGYDTLRADVPFSGTGESIVLRMTADPIALERITVVVDGFERLRSSGARVLDRIALHNSAHLSVIDIVRTRTGMLPTPCPERLSMRFCAFVRGRVVPVSVYVDGAHILDGGYVLASLPPDELYALMMSSGGRSIRVYTEWYMESVANGRRIPSDFLF